MKLFRSTIIFLVLIFFVACQKEDSVVIKTVVSGEHTLQTTSIESFEFIAIDVNCIVSIGYSYKIIDRLIEMINATPDTSEIYFAVMDFDLLQLLQALENADKRGVKTHLLIDYRDGDSDDDKVNIIQQYKLFTNGETVLFLNDAGSTAINHNKFMLFSSINTEEGVVEKVSFQTSHNFTYAGAKKIQDGLILNEDGLYDAYLNYWNTLKDKSSSGMTDYYYREYNNSLKGITACFFPKRRNGSFYEEDTYIDLLDSIVNPSRATVQIGMSLWTTSRSQIFTKLGELAQEGATIEIITKESNGKNLIDTLTALESYGVWVNVYKHYNIHSKFMLIKEERKNTVKKIVVTGSHNITFNALRYNAETILIIENSDLFDQYQEYYRELKNLD